MRVVQRGARPAKPARNNAQALWKIQASGLRVAPQTGIPSCLPCREDHPRAKHSSEDWRGNLASLPRSTRSESRATASQVHTMPFLCPCQLRVYSSLSHSTGSSDTFLDTSVCPAWLYVPHSQITQLMWPKRVCSSQDDPPAWLCSLQTLLGDLWVTITYGLTWPSSLKSEHTLGPGVHVCQHPWMDKELQ